MHTASEATGTSSRAGWLPFRVAIVVVVVGLLVVTCGSLIAYVLYRGEQSVELLKSAYLEQVAATTVREVSRLPATAAQVLRVQRYRLETGYYSTLEMGVGSDTGAAVVGNMGSPRRIKYGVVGDIVNVAARIETFTVGGQVLVSDATRQALGDRLVTDGPLEVEGKGLGAAIRLWEVLALQGDPPLALPAQVRHLAVLTRRSRYTCASSSASGLTGSSTRPGYIGSEPGAGKSNRTRPWQSLMPSRYS